MKRILFFILVSLIFQANSFADTYKVRPDQSSIGWLATKVGGEHTGGIEIKSGFLEFEGEDWVGGEAVIDMESISVEDIKKPSVNQKLVKHLKNEDFFNVKEHKTATIKIVEIAKMEDGSFDVVAEITIKDITDIANFPVTMNQVGNTITAQAMFEIDRTLYDVQYGSGKFFEDLGDRLIHDEFSLVVNILAEKNN